MYIVYAPQYLTRGDIKTIHEYLETRSDKSRDNEELKYQLKSGFAIGTKFATPYSNLFMAGSEKIIFQNSEFKCGYDTLMRFSEMDSVRAF